MPMRQTIERGGGWLAWVTAAVVATVLTATPAATATAAELLAQAQRGPPPGQPVQPPPSVETSIAQLHQELHITPAQEGAFSAFAGVMRENAGAAQSMAPPGSRLSAVAGLRLSIQAMQQELAGLQRLLPALEALYASLSPQQKQIADRIFTQPPPG